MNPKTSVDDPSLAGVAHSTGTGGVVDGLGVPVREGQHRVESRGRRTDLMTVSSILASSNLSKFFGSYHSTKSPLDRRRRQHPSRRCDKVAYLRVLLCITSLTSLQPVRIKARSCDLSSAQTPDRKARSAHRLSTEVVGVENRRREGRVVTKRNGTARLGANAKRSDSQEVLSMRRNYTAMVLHSNVSTASPAAAAYTDAPGSRSHPSRAPSPLPSARSSDPSPPSALRGLEP